MKLLSITFGALGMYGMVTGALGGAILALLMCILTEYAHKVFRWQDLRWTEDPRSAHKMVPTTVLLEQEGCECVAGNYLSEISKPE